MRQAEGVSRSNYTNDAKRLGRFVDFIGKDKPGNSITPPEVRAWLEDLKKEDLGPKSINHHLRALSMALGRGVAEGWVLKNPCSAVQGPKVEVKEVSVLSLADAIKLFKVNKGSRVAVYMALEAMDRRRPLSMVLARTAAGCSIRPSLMKTDYPPLRSTLGAYSRWR